MTATTILIVILAAIAGVMGTLYYQGKAKAAEQNNEVQKLSSELSELKLQMVRKDASAGDITTSLTTEVVADFLKREKTNDVHIDRDTKMVIFRIGEETFNIDCERLPQQLIFRKGYNMEGADIRWDVLQRAAVAVTEALVMVKVRVFENNSYDYYIVTTDHALASLRENFPFYMSLIIDAERMFREEYWTIMEREYPDEVPSDDDKEQETSAAHSADEGIKVALPSSDKKIMS